MQWKTLCRYSHTTLRKGSLQSLDWNGGMEWWNGIVECVLQGERSLLMQFFIMVTPVEVCNHGPEGSELHKPTLRVRAIF